jgi:hypothetical protein
MHILQDDPHEGEQYEVTVHHALATTATFPAGRDDASRRALSTWCYEEAHHLNDTVWGDFPHRSAGAMESIIPEIGANMGPRYAGQVGLVAALNTNLDDTNMELQDLRDQQAKDRMEIKGLRQ